MGSSTILMLETRRSIYNFIQRFPGLHLRELSRRLDVPFSTLKYHLRFLEKRGLIFEKAEGRYNRYYISDRIGRYEKDIFGELRKDTPRLIILYLLIHIYSSQVDMSGSLGKHPTTIEFHLRRLCELDVIEVVEPVDGKLFRDVNPRVIDCEPVGKERIYVLKDPALVYDLLTVYKESLLEDAESGLVMDFVDSFARDFPERLSSPKEWEDMAIEALFDIFPHPFHV